MLKRLAVLLLLLSSLLVFSTQASEATITIKFDPTPMNVTPGAAFAVDVVADTSADFGVAGFSLGLDYDKSVMALQSADLNSYFTDLNPGTLDGIYGRTFSPPLGGSDVTLATLNFTCLGIGSSTLDLFANDVVGVPFLGGVYGSRMDMVGNIFFVELDWTHEQGLVNQTPAPEPSTMLLIGTGLIGLAGFRRKFKA